MLDKCNNKDTIKRENKNHPHELHISQAKWERIYGGTFNKA
jgi:hypothetical protein